VNSFIGKFVLSWISLLAFLAPPGLWAQSGRTGGQPAGEDLETVRVEGPKTDGSAEAGYIAGEAVNFGPWGDKPVLDLPYTVSIASSGFIENIQAKNPGDILKRLPNMFDAWSSEGNWINSIITRGFRSLQKNIMNGIQTDNVGLGIFVEDLESLEVMSGLSGFMYGIGNVGGIAVYNLKKPTYDYLNKLRFGDNGGGQFFAHFDSGGPIAGGKLAYRLNVMAQDGNTSIDRQKISKNFVSGALDWNIAEGVLLQLHGSFGKIDNDGRQGAFMVRENEDYIRSAPDPGKLWVSDDTFNDVEASSFDMNFKAALSQHFGLRLGYAHRETERKSIITVSYFDAGRPDSYSWEARALDWKDVSDGAYAYLDSKFDTFGIEHNLTVGANGYEVTEYIGKWAGVKRTVFIFANNLPGSFRHNYAADFDLNRYGIFGNNYEGRAKDYTTFIYNLVVGDEIKFNDRWQLMLGLNYAHIKDESFDNSGARTQTYDSKKATPTASLIFKPVPFVTTYASFIESLESGGIAGPTYANAGQLLKPMDSEQYEIGVKAMVGGVLLTGAWFQTDKSLNYAGADNVLTQDGRERHRGFEFTVTGKALDSLTLLGGFTYLDARMLRTQNGALDGRRPKYVPKTIGKMYVEYDAPFIEGLTLTGGVDYYGSSYANNSNLAKVPSHATVDLGLRFRTRIYGKDSVFRFDVTNLTDKAYWGAEPGAELFLAQPRTFILTGAVEF
jgi:iron complex outermembrane receptor protein